SVVHSRSTRTTRCADKTGSIAARTRSRSTPALTLLASIEKKTPGSPTGNPATPNPPSCGAQGSRRGLLAQGPAHGVGLNDDGLRRIAPADPRAAGAPQ